MPSLTNPSPVPSNRIGLTRHRLWVLYQFLDLIKAEIEDLTGWTRGEIDAGLDRWDLRQFASASYFATDLMIEDAIAKRLGIRRTIGNMEELAELRHQFRDRLHEQYRQAGRVDWEAVDAFPEPPAEEQAA